jgi:hypothetical protein
MNFIRVQFDFIEVTMKTFWLHLLIMAVTFLGSQMAIAFHADFLYLLNPSGVNSMELAWFVSLPMLF